LDMIVGGFSESRVLFLSNDFKGSWAEKVSGVFFSFHGIALIKAM
jgi:hypothetical protein